MQWPENVFRLSSRHKLDSWCRTSLKSSNIQWSCILNSFEGDWMLYCDSMLVFQKIPDNWSTFSKMELFSKTCKILLRPPITFIFFLNEPPWSKVYGKNNFKLRTRLVFSKNRCSHFLLQNYRSPCTHLPTERDLLLEKRSFPGSFVLLLPGSPDLPSLKVGWM